LSSLISHSQLIPLHLSSLSSSLHLFSSPLHLHCLCISISFPSILFSFALSTSLCLSFLPQSVPSVSLNPLSLSIGTLSLSTSCFPLFYSFPLYFHPSSVSLSLPLFPPPSLLSLALSL